MSHSNKHKQQNDLAFSWAQSMGLPGGFTQVAGVDGEALLRVVGVVGRDREDRRVLFLIRLKANSISMVVLVYMET